MEPSTCVVISHYDQRPTDDLYRLLEQLKHVDAGMPFRLVISVNCDDMTKSTPLAIDPQLADVIYRPNGGYNMGSWDEAWRRFPGHKWYVFLQDECVVVRSKWLKAYVDRLDRIPLIGILTESKIYHRSWQAHRKAGEEVYQHCLRISQSANIPLGRSPTHAQTLVVAMGAQTLQALDGFLLADEKLAAVATEVMLSRKAVARGGVIQQASLHPFEFVSHPQWSDLRTNSKRLSWVVMRFVNRLITGD